MKNKFYFLLVIILVILALYILNLRQNNQISIVAIANYGPNSSLGESLNGFKEEMKNQGFIENQTIKYQISDVGFDPALIPQMITKLKSSHPKVMMVMTTPVAQFAKGHIHDIPLVYNVITNPVEAGLIKDNMQVDNNITGSSDRQNLEILLNFVKKIIPNASKIGLLYSTSESNDVALVEMMKSAASKMNMSLVAISIDQVRDIPTRMQEFKDKVDMIYVGTSGPIQPALPVISSEAKKMSIPVFNADEGPVKEGLVLASYGVNYNSVGKNAARIVASLLKGENIKNLKPVFPTNEDHYGFINKKKAVELGIAIPDSLEKVEIIN